MAKASLVAAKLRLIDSASFWLAFGRTENCSSSAGQIAPTITLDSTSSTVASAGICRLRRKIAAKKAIPQKIEMNIRINLAGITAFKSV